MLKNILLTASIFLASMTLAHADFKAYAGTFLSPTATGNQSITGVGFTPKVVIFLSSIVASGSTTYESGRIGLGVGVSSSSRHCIGYSGASNAATAQAQRISNSAKCLCVVNHNSSTVLLAADFVSHDADGFTVNFSTVQASPRQVHYLALGGSDLQVYQNRFASDAATGNKAITGVGFKPDIVLFNTNELSDADSASGAASGLFGTGAAISSSSQFALGEYAKGNATTPTDTASILLGTKVISRLSDSSTVGLEADYVSADNNGFTLNFTTAVTRRVFYLALAGIKTKIGAFSEPTTTGKTFVKGMGFKPSAVMLFSISKASSASIQNGHNLMITFADEFGHTYSHMIDGQDNITSNSKEEGKISQSHLLMHGTANTTGTPITINADATLVRMTSDGFEYNMTTANATSREVYYIALGPNPTNLYNVSNYNVNQY